MNGMALFAAAGGGGLEKGLERALDRGRALAGQLERTLRDAAGTDEEEAFPDMTVWEAPAGVAVPDNLAETVVNAVREGMRETALRLDAEALSRALLEPLSRGLARQAYARRYGA